VPFSSFAIARVVSLHLVHEDGELFLLRRLATRQLKGGKILPVSVYPALFRLLSVLQKFAVVVMTKAIHHPE
jgi:hypothetical protein